MPIKETPDTGISYEKAMATLWSKAYELRALVDSLYSTFNSTNITDLNSYRVRQLKRMSLMVDSFIPIVVKRKDLVSTHIIHRCLSDSVVAFFLIYDNDEPEKVLLRHYLYILDGNYDRNDAVGTPDFSIYPESIRDNAKVLYEESKKNYEDTMALCESKIKELAYYKANTSKVNDLISARNWKYQTIEKPKEKVYWKTLYSNSDKLVPADYTSYLSEDIHGLSFSVENLEPSPNNFAGDIMHVAYLCERLMNYMERRMGMLWLPQVQAYYDKITSGEFKPQSLSE